MVIDLQRAGMWKRLAAWMFDCILVARGHQSRDALEKTGYPVVETLSEVLEYVQKGD